MPQLFQMTQRGETVFHASLSELTQCASFAEWDRRFGPRRAISTGDQTAANESAELRAECQRLTRETEQLKEQLRQRAALSRFSAATPTDPTTPAATLTATAAPHAGGDAGRREASPRDFPGHIRFASGSFNAFGKKRNPFRGRKGDSPISRG